MIDTTTNFDYERNTYITQDCYKEILKLDKLLTEANIIHTCNKFCDVKECKRK